MVISLWPAAVIVVSFANGASSTNTAESTGGTESSEPSTAKPPESTETSESTESAPPTPEADTAGLYALYGRLHQLLKRMDSKSIQGTPDPALADALHKLTGDYEAWESQNAGLDSEADKIEHLELALAKRTEQFARRPSQARLDAFNHAVSKYNAGIR
jgi:hypothetical protein